MIDTLHILVRDMKGTKRNNMKKYINAILSISSILVLFYIIYDQHKQIKAQEIQIDSLQGDLFQAQDALGRYELGVEHLEEIDIQRFNEVMNFIDNETE